MLGKTHRNTGIALVSFIAMQESSIGNKLIESNPITNFLYAYVTEPIMSVFKLSVENPIHGLTLDSRGWLLTYVLTLYVLWYALVLPDIDSKNSILGRHVPFIEDIFGHRTIFHSLVPVVLLSFLTWVSATLIPIGTINLVLTQFLLLTTIGYTFHLIEDSFSIKGINWVVFPIKHKYSKLRYEVGGPFETIIYWISTGVIVLTNLVIIGSIL